MGGGNTSPELRNVLPEWRASLFGPCFPRRLRSRKKIATAMRTSPTTPTPAPIPAWAPAERPGEDGFAG